VTGSTGTRRRQASGSVATGSTSADTSRLRSYDEPSRISSSPPTVSRSASSQSSRNRDTQRTVASARGAVLIRADELALLLTDETAAALRLTDEHRIAGAADDAAGIRCDRGAR
jgi:hypothetical protein